MKHPPLPAEDLILGLLSRATRNIEIAANAFSDMAPELRRSNPREAHRAMLLGATLNELVVDIRKKLTAIETSKLEGKDE